MKASKGTLWITTFLFLLSLCGCAAPLQSESAPAQYESVPVQSAPEAESEPSEPGSELKLEAGPGLDLESFVAGVSAQRQSNLRWTEEELQLAASYADACADVDSPLLEGIGLKRLVTQGQGDASFMTPVSKEGVLEDIQVLFEMLRSTYGPYGYFGGDEVFNALQDELLEEFSQSSRETFVGLEVIQTLKEKLSAVIMDSHFLIGGFSIVANHMKTYYVPNLYFDDPSGFQEELVKPTIGPEGQITYCLATLSVDGEDLPETLTLNGVETELNWLHAAPSGCIVRKAYERTEKEGITFLVSRTLMRTESTADGLDALASSGEEYQSISPLVIDLRGNGGGNSAYAMQWLGGYLGQPILWKTIQYQRNSPLFRAMLEQSELYSDSPLMLRLSAQESGLIELGAQNGVWQSNDCAIFVLVDESVGSAGEDFVKFLRTVEHAIIVGSNTYGAQISGNIFIGYLPNSDIPVQFGTKLNLEGGLSNFDDTGYLPDLWVPPVEADTAVIRLCQYYGLTSS